VTIALDPHTAARGAEARGVLELGIRPMHLQVYGSAVDDGVPVTIKTVEDQGSHKILTVTLNGHTLHARVPEGHPIPQNQAWLRFPPQRTKLFADERLVR
jgi:glycerol transport system ATP-binding protein